MSEVKFDKHPEEELAETDPKMGPFRFVGWRAGFEWKLRDMWVGAYWNRIGNCIDVWICVIPCVPFHVSWWWSREP